ncbi:3-oxoacyl-[acyl-carrier-protein] synthase II [Desulfonauticus submarinus]|uniref:3-oxoacyl-[acyl-carrier-protein] synthase II n=1 Tax=Desulfonauticus submarinus TaxID=206665 RepID=A0A1H0FTJ1_9BACT|nr:beta-ketoacyl-[acyl-carrier-protein] synthase family protein [Desulfonauticus submarinus]SDN97960.1 3-oxoacyl-[acyl-carrier-protein] synthase II [Desulfonauticus submarinus]
MRYKPAQVTGMGCICSLGISTKECEHNLFKSQAPLPKPPQRYSVFYTSKHPVFEVSSKFHSLIASEYANLNLSAQFMLSATTQAIEDAGYTLKDLQNKNVGICIGTTTGASLQFLSFYKAIKENQHPSVEPIIRYLKSNPSLALQKILKTKGPCQTIVNACASGTDALGIALSWLNQGICELVIAGGTDEITPITYNGFISLQITAPSRVKPFDKHRSGLNLGEGAGILILENPNYKKKNYGYIIGYGTTNDAHHITSPHPEGEGLQRAISIALQSCQKQSQDICFINSHGTGTKDNDLVEGNVLKKVFPKVPFISTKGYTGHALGAAGAIEAILTLLCLKKQQIPPSAGFNTLDPTIGIQPITKLTPLKGKLALSQSLAFGGNNSVLILQRGD